MLTEEVPENEAHVRTDVEAMALRRRVVNGLYTSLLV
jgi:hypothetical protein